MCWDEVRNIYPSQWLIIEAIDARTEKRKRIVDEITVVDTFSNNNEAMRKYIQLHKSHPNREMYVVHTSRPELDIEEIVWIGVRPK